METKTEYHDPDYPEIESSGTQKKPVLSDEERVVKIRAIVKREFAKELRYKENEVNQLDQRMWSARRLLHKLRYSLVNTFYQAQKLQLNENQIQDEIASQHDPKAKAEVASILRNEQKRLHPSLRRLLGKKQVDYEEIFKFRSPRNKVRKDYAAMVQSKNVTIPAENDTKTLRPEKPIETQIDQDDQHFTRPRKIPRHTEPKVDGKIVTVDEVTRNKQKYRFRVIIGNTSKYVPPASRLDRSTHKWLLYVRGPPDNPDISQVVTGVTARLHDTYAPHHVVHIEKAPYHISRRGWGEFPVKLELHFALPIQNRPATVQHTIKLDRRYTGLQTLGAETIVDVWLYSTPEMLKYEFKDEPQKPIDTEPQTSTTEPLLSNDNTWLDFLTTDSTELDVDEMIIKPIKKENDSNKFDFDSNVIDNLHFDSNNFDIHKTQNGEFIKIKSENEIKIEMDDDYEMDNKTNEQDIEDFEMLIKHEPIIKSDLEIQNLPIGNDKQLGKRQNLPIEILDQNKTPKKRIMKYIDPNSRKIYYLEMDIDLDLSKVQEIVINNDENNIKNSPPNYQISKLNKNGISKTVKKGVSLLKPEVKNQLKNELEKKPLIKTKNHFSHIKNDHCYLGNSWSENVNFQVNNDIKVNQNMPKPKQLLDTLTETVSKLTDVRTAVNFLLCKIPIITKLAENCDFVKDFPFVVSDEEKFWNLDWVKRRNIEWSRAKLINEILLKTFEEKSSIWRTKQILIFSRLHGYRPVKNCQELSMAEGDWSSWNDSENCHDTDKNFANDNFDSLSIFDETKFEMTNLTDVSTVNLTCDSDDDVDVMSDSVTVKSNSPVKVSNLSVLPLANVDERLRSFFIEKKCLEIGIELRNEDIGKGYSYSAVHAVMLSAMKSFVEELVRTALCEKNLQDSPGDGPWKGSESRPPPLIRAHHIWKATGASRLDWLRSTGLGTKHTDQNDLL